VPGERVQLGHGGGGVLQAELIAFVTQTLRQRRVNGGIGVDEFDDGATVPLDLGDQELVVTADGHTISPLFFPGGDLGVLSATGTINDILMMGGRPLALTSIVIVEEGLEFDTLGRVMASFNATLEAAGVAVIAGDTKVMPRGTLNQLVMATTGIGVRPRGCPIQDANCQVGDAVVVSGTLGDHGAALIAAREGIALDTSLVSDVAVLTPVTEVALQFPVHAMKDPTRGGLAAALNEWASKANVCIELVEEALPINPAVRAITGMLGLDPLEIASEGRALISVPADRAEELVAALRAVPLGRDATIIGVVTNRSPGRVLVESPLGGHRILAPPMGESIPRIC
jgi:hydrogenase expression/formation protein HypE